MPPAYNLKNLHLITIVDACMLINYCGHVAKSADNIFPLTRSELERADNLLGQTIVKKSMNHKLWSTKYKMRKEFHVILVLYD